MKRLFSILFLVLYGQLLLAQNNKLDQMQSKRDQVAADTSGVSRKSTSNKNIKNKDATIDLYKIISFRKDTTIVDTTLSLKKNYKFNYLRKDNFELISFSNVGQTYNTLSHGFQYNGTLPLFGARARHFNYMEVTDIDYYHMPTPFTELFYKSAFEQGQVLDAFFTVNTSRQFNFSIAYKGLRSLGNYQHILTSTGNFRFTSNYHSKNKRYNARAHIVMQDLLNEENGGLQDEDLVNFESGTQEFIDRSVFDPNFEDAENILVGKRFYLDHEYIVMQKKDSIKNNNLSIGHVISLEDKFYRFTQNSQNDYFGEAFRSSDIYDKSTLENFYTQLTVNYSNKDIGTIGVNIDYNDYNYGYDTVVVLDDEVIRNRLKGHNILAGASYKQNFGKFNLFGEFGVNVSGDFDGNFVNANASYQLNDDINLKGTFLSSSKPANYNQLLYQSGYLNYNWDNADSYDNINTQKLSFQFLAKKLAGISVDYTNIGNYTYFRKDEASSIIKPTQDDNPINYLRVKLDKEIKFGKFALDNTIMYQNVIDGEGVLNVPEIITRNTFYYSNHLFKKAMYLQTGITFNYFTEYNMNGYDPLLAEFYTQNEIKLGGFPRLDFFVNAKIRQTRIYLKVEHLNSGFTGYNYYSAPNTPYRDFAIRFGLVWNFFL